MTQGTLATSLLLGGLFLMLFVWGRWMPLRKPTSALPRRLFVNLSISALALITAVLVVGPAGASRLQLASGRGFGLLHLMKLSPGVQFVAGFVLMDLSFYYWARRQSQDRVPMALSQRAPHRSRPGRDDGVPLPLR